MRQTIILLDVGSTFIKAAVFDAAENRLIFTEKFHTPPRRPDPDPMIFENSAEEFVRAVKRAVRRCIAAVPQAEGLLLSTQQHGCVLSRPGVPEDIYISWQDSRCLRTDPATGASYLEGLEVLLPPEVMQNTGVPVKPALALCNLYTLCRQGRIPRQEGGKIYTLGSYIIQRLTGNNICHITNAAPMGFTNILNGSWRWDILEKAELDFLQLPEIITGLGACGVYEEDGCRLTVYPDVGDVQTSVYGTDACSGDMIVNVATSGQLIYISDEYVPGEYEIRPYYDGNYCNVISRMPGGRNFDVQIDYLREIGRSLYGQDLAREEIWKRICEAVPRLEDGGLEVDCSFYELPDRLAGGAIRGIDRANLTLAHVISATAMDFGRQYRRFADVLCDYSRFSGTLHLSGGAILKNPLLRQAVTQAMNAPRTVAASADEVYGGLFKLARKCLE